ncbi:MAG: HEAT repeat domain-containing protein [bacterium]
MELVISKRLYLVFSGLLVLLVCMLFSCGQQSKEQEAAKNKEEKTTGLELIDKSKEQKVEAKEQPKIQSKKEINETESTLSQKEKKKIEKRALEIINRIEKLYVNFLEMILKEEKVKEKVKLVKELKEIDKEICRPILLNAIKDKKKNWIVRSVFISVLIEDLNIKDDEITNLLIEIANDPKEDILLQKGVTDTLQEDFGIKLPKAKLSDKEIEKKVKRLIKEINLVCMFMPNIYLAVGIAGFYGQDIEEIGGPAIPIVVREFAKRRNWKTRFYLGSLLERLVEIRDKEGYFLRHNTHTEYSNNVAQVLGKILENKRENMWIRLGAAKGLIAGGDKAIEPLVRVLRTIECEPSIPLDDEKSNQKEQMRENFCDSVLYSLGNLLENSEDKRLIEEAIDAIKDKLYDKNNSIQRSAVSALGGGGVFSKRARDILIDTLKNHESGDVKARVPGALANVYDHITDENEKERIVDALIEAATGGSLEVEGFKGIIPGHRNIFAIEMLGEIKAKKAVEPLIETLKDENGLIVDDAARALAKIGDKRAVEPLIEAFKKEDDWGTRQCIAIFSLSKFKDERVIRFLEKALFEPRNKMIKGELALALGDIGDKKTVDLLIEVLDDAIKDKDEMVTYGCSFALCKIGDKKAIPYVEKALKEGTWDYHKDWVVKELKKLKGN